MIERAEIIHTFTKAGSDGTGLAFLSMIWRGISGRRLDSVFTAFSSLSYRIKNPQPSSWSIRFSLRRITSGAFDFQEAFQTVFSG
jgi:hypothetical protein